MRIKEEKIFYDIAEGFYNIESRDIYSVLSDNGVKVLNMSPAGSLRRRRKTIGDLDIVLEVDDPYLCGEVLKKHLGYEFFIKGAFYKGKIVNTGIDLFVAGKYDFYSMLFFLTGSEDWNLRIMKHLIENTDIRYTPFKFINKNNNEVYQFNSEEEIFKLIGHNYVLPKDRIPHNINFGEINEKVIKRTL